MAKISLPHDHVDRVCRPSDNDEHYDELAVFFNILPFSLFPQPFPKTDSMLSRKSVNFFVVSFYWPLSGMKIERKEKMLYESPFILEATQVFTVDKSISLLVLVFR